MDDDSESMDFHQVLHIHKGAEIGSKHVMVQKTPVLPALPYHPHLPK